MKRLLTGFAVTLVAAVWMMGSWFIFNSIPAGTQWSVTPAVAEVSENDPQDTGAVKEKSGEHWKHHHWGRHGHHHFLWKKLNLTDAQKKDMFSLMYAVLTPEQRAKVERLREKWKCRHEKKQKHQD